jgi:hypothetical protein
MHISSLRLFNKWFCLTLLFWVTLCGIHTVSLAEEPESQVKEPAPPTAGRVIVINPETGEIDPSAKTAPPEFKRETVQPTTSRETATRREDGTLSIDFNGKFMKPVYGHVDKEGKVVISHEQEKK